MIIAKRNFKMIGLRDLEEKLELASELMEKLLSVCDELQNIEVVCEVDDMAANKEIKTRMEREGGTMTLQEAIVHAKEKAEKLNGTCAREHSQLVKWLEELQQYRDKAEKGDGK